MFLAISNLFYISPKKHLKCLQIVYFIVLSWGGGGATAILSFAAARISMWFKNFE